MDVGRRGTANCTAERAVANDAGNRLARERDIEDQRVQLATRARMAAALFDQVLGERCVTGEHGGLLSSFDVRKSRLGRQRNKLGDTADDPVGTRFSEARVIGVSVVDCSDRTTCCTRCCYVRRGIADIEHLAGRYAEACAGRKQKVRLWLAFIGMIGAE